MLCAHSAVACLPETSAIRRLLITGTLDRALETGGVAAAIELLEDDSRMQFLEFDWHKLFETHAIVDHAKPALNWYVALLHEIQIRSQSRYVLDKDPGLIEHLRWIREQLPKAIVIHVIRDPRDVLASKLAAEWSKHRHWLYHVLTNRILYGTGVRAGAEFVKGQYCEVVYEQLLADPQRVLTQLCRQLDLPYEFNMLSFGQAARQLVRPDEVSWKKETFGPLLQENTAKWKMALSPLQIAVTNRSCRPAIERSGQPVAGDPLPLWSRLLSMPVSTALAVLDRCYRMYKNLP